MGIYHIDYTLGNSWEESPIGPGSAFSGTVIGEDGAGRGGDVVDFDAWGGEYFLLVVDGGPDEGSFASWDGSNEEYRQCCVHVYSCNFDSLYI